MKKHTLICLVLLALFITSCGGTKKIEEPPKKVEKITKKVIEGNWNINNISYSEDGDYLLQLFNDTSKECFEGSTWSFTPNDNTGIYSINNSDCPQGDRNFIFIIDEINPETKLFNFVLRPINVRGNTETNYTGFKLQLIELTDSKMIWEQTLDFDGKPLTISVNFSKSGN